MASTVTVEIHGDASHLERELRRAERAVRRTGRRIRRFTAGALAVAFFAGAALGLAASVVYATFA